MSVAGAGGAHALCRGEWTTSSRVKAAQVRTQATSYREQGQRLENSSWRLHHLQNLMVDTD